MMPQPGFKPTVAQLPATGRGPRPGVIFIQASPTLAVTPDATPPKTPSLVIQPGQSPRFGQPDLIPKPTKHGPIVGEGGVILAGAALGLALASFGLAATDKALAPLILGGKNLGSLIRNNALFLASPPGRKFFHFSFALFFPHTEQDPRQERLIRVLGFPFQDLDTTGFDFQQRQLQQQWIRVANMAEVDLGRFTGQQLAQLEALIPQITGFRQTFKTQPGIFGLASVTEPDFLSDLGRLIGLRRQLEDLERQWQLNSDAGFGSPISGPAIGRGDQADP